MDALWSFLAKNCWKITVFSGVKLSKMTIVQSIKILKKIERSHSICVGTVFPAFLHPYNFQNGKRKMIDIYKQPKGETIVQFYYQFSRINPEIHIQHVENTRHAKFHMKICLQEVLWAIFLIGRVFETLNQGFHFWY